MSEQTTIELRVYGMPAPQGSKAFKGMAGGHAILVESSKKVKPWRQDVKQAVVDAGHPHISGPVVVDMIFTLPKPKSAPKRRVTYPATRPDLSKLVRSTEDALTDVGLWEDDSRVVRCFAYKVYPGEHCYALESPGAVIIVKALDGEDDVL